MAKRGTETVEVRRRPTKDPMGDPVPGEKVGDLTACIIWPRSSSEQAERGTVSIEGFNVWAPAPYAVTPKATDVVVVRGEEHEVEGVPGDWRTKRGRQQGLLFQTKRYGT